MKKKIFAGVVLASIIGTTFGLAVGCGDDNKNKAYAFNNLEELYSFSVISGMELALNGSSVSSVGFTQDEFDKMVDSVHSYLPAFEGFLGGEQIIVPTEKPSDDSNFSRMLDVNYTDLSGTVHQYKIYFNETIPSQGGALWEKGDNEEIETQLQGQVILDGNNYAFSGVKEIDNGETEINFDIKIDDQLSVRIEQETEKNEQEFSYALVNNGHLVYSNSISIETKNGKVEFETEYETPEKKLELEIKQVYQNNEPVFYIEYEENGVENKIEVKKINENGEINYVYTMGSNSSERIVK